MRLGLKYNNKKFSIDVKSCNMFKKLRGLMFSRKKTARALLFDFKKPMRVAIHSWFVFFPFIAIWLDTDNKIVELKIIQPFSHPIRPRADFCKLIEIPINEKYRGVIKLLVVD